MKKITKIEQAQSLELYTEVLSEFWCTRCSKRFWAKCFIETMHLSKDKEPVLADDRIVHFQTEGEAFLFCSRCSRAFWSFLKIR